MPTSVAPWAKHVVLGGFGPPEPTTVHVQAALYSHLSHNSYQTYGSVWKRFVTYCAQAHKQCLPATPYTVCHYLAYLLQEGTVNLETCGPYLSGINAVHRDAGYEQPAKGDLVSRVHHGLKKMQLELQPQPAEAPVPAAIMRQLYAAATTRAEWLDYQTLRALLAVLVIYVTASRPVSIAALPKDQLTLDGGMLTVTRLYVKTTQTRQQEVAGRLPIRFPVRFAPLARALAAFSDLRDQKLPHATFFFQLPGDDYTMPPETNGHLAAVWWGQIQQHFCLHPPTGLVWNPRCLRSGAASASEASGVPRSKTEYLGGWCPGSTALTKHYIDPSMLCSAHTRFFFDWLAPTPSGA